MKQEWQKHIDATLNSLDGASRAEASPFLYGKVRNRMQTAAAPLVKHRWKLALALATIVLLNLLTMRHMANENSISNAEAATVASDYSITIPDSY